MSDRFRNVIIANLSVLESASPEDDSRIISFRTIAPEPDGLTTFDTKRWRNENWGSSEDAVRTMTPEGIMPQEVLQRVSIKTPFGVQLDTADGPAIPFTAKLSAANPGEHIIMVWSIVPDAEEYHDVDDTGFVEYMNGECIHRLTDEDLSDPSYFSLQVLGINNLYSLDSAGGWKLNKEITACMCCGLTTLIEHTDEFGNCDECSAVMEDIAEEL